MDPHNVAVLSFLEVQVGESGSTELRAVAKVGPLHVEREDDTTGEDGGEENVEDDVLLEAEVLDRVWAHDGHQFLVRVCQDPGAFHQSCWRVLAGVKLVDHHVVLHLRRRDPGHLLLVCE